MPEGDTIHRLAAMINDRFGGRAADWSIVRHPRLATVDVAGRVLIDATSHGKHLFLNWDDGWSLHIHLLMQGRVVAGGASSTPEWRRRFEITFDGGGHLVGIDIPVLRLVRTSEIERVVDHLGPDLCGPLDQLALDIGVDRLAADGSRQLAAALLDQRNLAGFGNIYAVEVPYICGLSPFQPVGDLDDLAAVVAVGAALIRTNARLGPQNTTGRRLHQADHWILDQRTRSCPKCGHQLGRMTGRDTPWGRMTAWCPDCQTATAVDRARVRKLLALHPARRLLDFDHRLDGAEDGDGEATIAFIGG